MDGVVGQGGPRGPRLEGLHLRIIARMPPTSKVAQR